MQNNGLVPQRESMTQEQLNGLFENVDALDIPDEVRPILASTAWDYARCYLAALEAMDARQYDDVQGDEERAFLIASHTMELAGHTGLMIDIAEQFLSMEVAKWREWREGNDVRTIPQSPWSEYKPAISPARQRREQ